MHKLVSYINTVIPNFLSEMQFDDKIFVQIHFVHGREVVKLCRLLSVPLSISAAHLPLILLIDYTALGRDFPGHSSPFKILCDQTINFMLNIIKERVCKKACKLNTTQIIMHENSISNKQNSIQMNMHQSISDHTSISLPIWHW